MTLNDRIKAFVLLGKKIGEALDRDEGAYEGLSKEQINLLVKIKQAGFKNGWFTNEMTRKALSGVVSMLEESEVVEWMSAYVDELSKTTGGKEVGVIMAGNLPAVGFHDFLCVLLSGNKVVGKLSSDDEELIPAVAELLIAIEPAFTSEIEFLKTPRKEFDAVIATGSDNSARYFEQYFGHFPNIIRKSRTSVAVITPEETREDFTALASDMFTYFGLGCRNVSKILLVGDVEVRDVMEPLTHEVMQLDLNKYQNNLDYNKSIYLINKVPFLDGGAFLFKEDEALHSPVSVTYYQKVNSLDEAEKYLEDNAENIQCVVSPRVKGGVPFGTAQMPKVWDYADKVDTLRFLIGLG